VGDNIFNEGVRCASSGEIGNDDHRRSRGKAISDETAHNRQPWMFEYLLKARGSQFTPEYRVSRVEMVVKLQERIDVFCHGGADSNRHDASVYRTCAEAPKLASWITGPLDLAAALSATTAVLGTFAPTLLSITRTLRRSAAVAGAET
jgi:hypothetical protein